MLFSTLILHGQTSTTDSLINLLSGLDESGKTKILISIANELSLRDTEEAEKYALQAVQYSESLNNKTLYIEATYALGCVYFKKQDFNEMRKFIDLSMNQALDKNNSDYIILNQIVLSEYYFKQLQFDSALVFLSKAKVNAINNNNEDQLAAIYNNEGKIADTRGNFVQAIELYIKSANIYEKLNNQTDLAVIYNNIGTLHLSLDNFKNAIYYLKRAENINNKLGLLINLNMNYSNLGVIYKELDSLEIAKEYYLKSVELAKLLDNDYQLARVFMNLGNLYVKQKQYKPAYDYFDSSKAICEKIDLQYGILLNNINIGGLLLLDGHPKEAIKLLKNAEETLVNMENPNQLASVYEMLSDAYVKNNQFKKALVYHKKSDAIADSINSVQTNSKILELQTKYEQKKNLLEILQLQQQVTLEKSRQRYYIIGLLLTLIAALIITFLLFIQRKKSQYNSHIAGVEKKKLQLTMELKDKELVSKALEAARMNEVICQVNNQLNTIMPDLVDENANKINTIVNNLKAGLPNKAWKEFETRYEQVHKEFYNKLVTIYPTLTPSEIKTCGFLRLNLTTKDISFLTSRSVGTIENSRSSIRKKMKLEQEDNLTAFLLTL